MDWVAKVGYISGILKFRSAVCCRLKMLPLIGSVINNLIYLFTSNPITMENRKRVAIISFLLIVSLANYFAKTGNENVRAVQFISIFAIGALSALLIRELIGFIKRNK
jgi:hypothetical protein